MEYTQAANSRCWGGEMLDAHRFIFDMRTHFFHQARRAGSSGAVAVDITDASILGNMVLRGVS